MCFLFFPCVLFAQQERDTTYLDYNWSICESPAASYYRICAIEKSKYIFYKGPVEDYYINGQTEMTGSYDDKGFKDGPFVSYYPDGTMKSEGFFEDDEYKGVWKFYNQDGKIILKLFCNSENDFTPLLIINGQGDTVLKDGNGQFVLSPHDYKDIFSPASVERMKGFVQNGLKDGKIDFYNQKTDDDVICSESYNKGKFKRAFYNGLDRGNKVPQGLIRLYSEKLKKADDFFHINPLFGNGEKGNAKALDFVVRKTITGIPSEARAFEDDYKDIFNVVAYALNGILKSSNQFSWPANINDDGRIVFNRIGIQGSNNFKPRPLSCLVTITIDSTGYVANSTFKGNLQTNEIDLVNYYLGSIYGLKPYFENGIKQTRDINIRLYNYNDTSYADDTVRKVEYLYVLENADKQQLPPLPLLVDIEAKFPGGASAWSRYLERNLNPNVPSDHHAPNGIYTVLVSFMVEDDGKISDIKALNDPGYGTTEEALRVVRKSPMWTPAVKNGKNVAYRQTQAIVFQIAGY